MFNSGIVIIVSNGNLYVFWIAASKNKVLYSLLI